jgi:HK97 gp10 family phage protein
MSAQVKWEGLDELRKQLQALPKDLNREARGRVIAAANSAADDLKQAYPKGDTGNLRKGVKVKVEESEVATHAVVRSSAAHAHLWEFGTQNRKTQKLWNRGSGPAHYDQGLVGIASKKRRNLNANLIAIVKSVTGADVTGEP